MKMRSPLTKSEFFFTVGLAIWFLFCTQCLAAAENKSSDQSLKINRLVALCKLWGKVKFFHPSLAYRQDIDWDAALVKAIPKVQTARNSAGYKNAVQEMLNVLQDPATQVIESQSANNNLKERKFEYRLTDENILIVTIGNYFELFTPATQEKIRTLSAEVPKAKAIIFDLRSAESVGDYGKFSLTSSLSQIERLLSSTPILTIAERSRIYRGFGSSSAFSSGQYRSGFYAQNGRLITPLKDAKDVPSVFLLNKNSGLLSSTIALQSKGKSLVVFEGDFKGFSTAKTENIDLGEGISAKIRLTETLLEDGTSGDLQPDLIVAEKGNSSDESLQKAIELARNFKPSTLVRQKLPAFSIQMRENSYPEMKYPSPEYRLLAAFRIWNVFNYFFPYKHLMERDWESVLREFLPKLETSKDALDYSLTIAEMVTNVHDSHAFVTGETLNNHFGTGFPPLRVQLIEDSLIVTSITDEALVKGKGIEIGDVILKVDGEDAKARFARYGKYISASTLHNNADKASLTFMNGADKSIVTLTIRNRANKIKEVKLPRKFEDYNTLYHRERSGDIIKLLPNNIGYADLDRLTAEMVDEMFEKFKNTRGIIFDMRGYPNGLFWILPQRLTEKQDIHAALFETPIIGQFSEVNSSELFFQNIFPQTSKQSIYKGKTVMLIDERSMSQAEHTGLFFRAANGTTFIGSPTAGANGEVTTFSAPGGITIGFTGQSVKYPDGKQLQRIGLVPDILVKPTVKGIQAGRDEVLEKAQMFLAKEQKRTP